MFADETPISRNTYNVLNEETSAGAVGCFASELMGAMTPTRVCDLFVNQALQI